MPSTTTNAKPNQALKRPKKVKRKSLETKKNKNKKPGKATPHSVTKKIENEEKEERYVVVITNVENDFAKVHQEAVPRYCCLSEEFCYRAQQRRLSLEKADDDNNNNNSSNNNKTNSSQLSTFSKDQKEKQRRQCYYKVIPRTETRSVEVAIYGKADGDVSSVFLPALRSTHTAGQKREREKKKNSHNNNKNTGNGEAAPVVAHGKNDANDAVVECVNSPVGEKTVFESPEEMIMALRHVPYFTHPPKFLLNVAGKNDGEILMEAKPRKRLRTEVNKSQSTNEEDDDDDASKCKNLLQSSLRQADMITAVATTSSRIHTREINKQLKDIPGFISCWMLYPQHFRVVFATKKALFKAKELLDQFSLDNQVRVSLALSDGAAKEFTKHLASVEHTA